MHSDLRASNMARNSVGARPVVAVAAAAVAVLALLGSSAPLPASAAASCGEWFHGKELCPDKCVHAEEAGMVFEKMNMALEKCLEEVKPWSGMPIASGVVKNKCIAGINEKLSSCYSNACSNGKTNC